MNTKKQPLPYRFKIVVRYRCGAVDKHWMEVPQKRFWRVAEVANSYAHQESVQEVEVWCILTTAGEPFASKISPHFWQKVHVQ